MPKLTNKTLARKALKTIEPRAVEPIQEAKEGTEESKNGVTLSKIEQEITRAEQLLALSNRAEEVNAESSAKLDRLGVITGQRRDTDISEVHKTSIDKHVESMRFKIVWVANKLADELIHETSKKTKKDKEYIKGLVWSFGTMYDKLANINTDTVQVHIPAKLLEGVKSAISIQIARVQQLGYAVTAESLSSSPEVQPPIDITPIRSQPLRSTQQGVHAIHAPDTGTQRSIPGVAMRSDSVIATSTYDNHAEGVNTHDNDANSST